MMQFHRDIDKSDVTHLSCGLGASAICRLQSSQVKPYATHGNLRVYVVV